MLKSWMYIGYSVGIWKIHGCWVQDKLSNDAVWGSVVQQAGVWLDGSNKVEQFWKEALASLSCGRTFCQNMLGAFNWGQT